MSDPEGMLGESGGAAVADRRSGTWGQRLRWPLMIGVPALILMVAAFFILTSGKSQSTDDAYLQSARTAISPSIGGRVVEIAVRENQTVHKGDVLFKLDPGDYRVALAQAQAALAASRFSVQGSQAVYGQRQADLAAAQEAVAYTEREAARQKALAAAGVATLAQADEAAHAAEQARRQVAVVRQQIAAAAADLGGGLPVDRQPGVLKAQADLAQARLNLTYTVIVAPADGVVTKVEQLQVGSRVEASRPLFFLISGRPWVEANFKEDQLAHMRVGQPAVIDIDAYDRPLKGHVASFSPGTGSSFALLPPENATGNWVKVVQRLPVRIALDETAPNLSAGLSAKVKVDVRSGRTKP